MKDVYKVRNNTTYFKIKSIEPYDYEDDKVYCFEVVNTDEPYFTLPNGAITHNCRLRSERKSEYFNTFGAGSTKIGSLGVVTLNLPRLAYEANELSIGNKVYDKYTIFTKLVKEYYNKTAIINKCKREIIRSHIDNKAQPLYDMGFMELSKQYSTCGINGLYEALQILDLDILSKEGQTYTEELLILLGKCCSKAEKKLNAPHNLEQVPAESSAVKLAQKDHYFGINTEYELYSNQFIPLIAETDMLNRIHLQGKFDKLFSGGAICHINVSEKITSINDMSELIKYASKCGVVYFAINYKLKQCSNKHLWVGTEHCPICGGEVTDEYTRVVGFLTKVANWNKTRKKIDYPNRQFYSNVKIS
jgi:ribonucleoside-triphosphate reductase (formate)